MKPSGCLYEMKKHGIYILQGVRIWYEWTLGALSQPGTGENADAMKNASS